MKYLLYLLIIILTSIAIPRLVDYPIIAAIVGVVWCVLSVLLLHRLYIYIKSNK